VNAVRAEWTKLRTTPSTVWLALAAVAGAVALGSLVTYGLSTEPCETSCPYDTTKLSLVGVHLAQVGIVVIGVLAITNEYATRLIQITLTAVPRRSLAWAAKVGVVTVSGLFIAAIGVAGSLLAAREVLTWRGFPALSLTEEATRRAAIGTVLYLGLIGLLSLGIGAMVRDTAVAITVVLGLLYLAPMVNMMVSDPRWHRRLEQYAPMTAGLAVQATRGLDALPIGPWAGLGVLALYAGGAVLLAGVVFLLRDA
jgi:ABC-2 type transport system permease protein